MTFLAASLQKLTSGLYTFLFFLATSKANIWVGHKPGFGLCAQAKHRLKLQCLGRKCIVPSRGTAMDGGARGIIRALTRTYTRTSALSEPRSLNSQLALLCCATGLSKRRLSWPIEYRLCESARRSDLERCCNSYGPSVWASSISEFGLLCF